MKPHRLATSEQPRRCELAAIYWNHAQPELSARMTNALPSSARSVDRHQKCLWVRSIAATARCCKAQAPSSLQAPPGDKSRGERHRSGKLAANGGAQRRPGKGRTRRHLKRSIPFDRNPTSGSGLRIVVPDSEMLNAAIIPDNN